MRKSSLVFILSAGLAVGTAAHADLGADALLEQVGGKAGAIQPEGAASGLAQMSLKDPFLLQIASASQAHPELPYEVKAWLMKAYAQDFEGVAHLWTVIQKQPLGAFEPSARSLYLYSLHRLGLKQTLMDQWVQAWRDRAFLNSRDSLVLEQVLAPGFDQWLYTSGVQFSPEQEAAIQAMEVSRGPVMLTLHAAISLRKGLQGKSLLDQLPANHAYKPALARTVALAFAGQGDLSAAAKLLKNHVEPSIQAKGEVRALAKHYLQIARLLYQVGSLEGAASFYSKIPHQLPEYLTAQEELTWVRLRQGDLSQLRGSLQTLTSKLFEERFGPELYVVRAISNLKLCYYGQVEQDFNAFVRMNQTWAKRIDESAQAQDPALPPEVDEFTQHALARIELRQQELHRVNELAERSISAALPAVGQQQHWIQARQSLQAHLQASQKMKSEEIRRQWRGYRHELREAIRKMEFVKVELLTQVRMMRLGQNVIEKTPGQPKLAASAAAVGAEGKQSYPFDGLIWPDELFRLRAMTRGQCVGMEGSSR